VGSRIAVGSATESSTARIASLRVSWDTPQVPTEGDDVGDATETGFPVGAETGGATGGVAVGAEVVGDSMGVLEGGSETKLESTSICAKVSKMASNKS
jgi:hypothetical protein